MGSFDVLATVTASTKRQGAVSGGLSGDMVENIASLNCLPLDPVTPEVAQTMGIEAFAEVLQTMTKGGLDILEGDLFIVGSTEYKVRAVGEWYWRPSADNTALILLEEIK
ncbi:MAG: hypothetical protein SXV54_13950 [Chloroflexota bacterium]|nr:hypothetical protein [Chloroflexota bacterium]